MFVFAYIARFRAIILARDIKFPVADDVHVSCVLPSHTPKLITVFQFIGLIKCVLLPSRFHRVPAAAHAFAGSSTRRFGFASM